ncbi:hypothetical protein FACS189434_13480 [Bacteroidia bacterium]|nr:hypothetical protein FACS189434_13480 [Bacteroidia bacterium]
MGKFREVYITIEDFALLQETDRQYEGFVIGLGYAYVDTTPIEPPHFNGYHHAGDTPPILNKYTLVRSQRVDYSPEMKKMSLRGAVIKDEYYIVRKGDTLSAIADRFKTKVNDIVKWNRIADPDKIEVGQRLVVGKVENSFVFSEPKSYSKRNGQENATVYKPTSFPSITSTINTVSSVAAEAYYSKKFGTWMGKNFKLYKQQWGGNQYAGGKNKFGKKTSTVLKWVGRAAWAKSSYDIYTDWESDKLNTYRFVTEEASNTYSTFGGVYGIAWGIGWELGRLVTNLDSYQEFKFNTWYDFMEKRIGKPNEYNEHLWNEFFENYQP